MCVSPSMHEINRRFATIAAVPARADVVRSITLAVADARRALASAQSKHLYLAVVPGTSWQLAAA